MAAFTELFVILQFNDIFLLDDLQFRYRRGETIAGNFIWIPFERFSVAINAGRAAKGIKCGGYSYWVPTAAPFALALASAWRMELQRVLAGCIKAELFRIFTCLTLRLVNRRISCGGIGQGRSLRCITGLHDYNRGATSHVCRATCDNRQFTGGNWRL